jgi:di/tricarboxylate transporter
MTAQMIIALAILILMIVMIMSDKFSFGAPPLLACCLLVLTGTSTIADAFSGFIDTNIIMIAGFLAVTAALQKTSFMHKIESTMSNLAAKGGFKAYVLILLVVMLGASVTAGVSAYYIMIITLASTIPYNKGLPNSKLVMPMGFAAGRALVPFGVAFFMGLAASLLDSAGYQSSITLPKFAIVVFFVSMGYLAWALIAYRFLPDHDVAGGGADMVEKVNKDEAALPQWKERCVYVAALVSIVVMLFAGTIGEPAYITPGLASAFLCAIGVFNFKELRGHIFSPMIVMMGSVIGVAKALANSGFNEMVGQWVADTIGGNTNIFVLTLVFCLLTSVLSTITGATIGSLFVFAPIGIATCMSLGLDPTGLAVAVTLSVFSASFLPIDGQPALIFGMGRYKLSQFLKFTIPMYLIQMLALAVGSVIAFPV